MVRGCMGLISRGAVSGCMCAVLLWCSGCGLIADKDRIKVAKLGDQYITRGDLFKVLRDMSDEERPNIETKGDLIRVLRNTIDGQIRRRVADDLEQKLGKPLIARDLAQQRFFASHPDENYQVLFTNVDPKALDMAPEEWQAAKEQAELEIDKVMEQMRGETAVGYRAMEEFKAGSLKVSDEELQREYNLQRDELKMPEKIGFAGLRFVTSLPNAEGQAADVRRRLNAGESFDALVDEYLAKDKSCILDSDIVNDGSPRFSGFWVNASGSQPGDVIGPVFLPEYEAVGTDASGRRIAKRMPDAYLVFRVMEHAAERALTLEEAKPQLLPGILVAKMMEQLWEQNGAEIYENKLPDPGMFSRKIGDPISGRR